MPSLQEEAEYWAGQASAAHHDMLQNIRNTAGKWQAAIAAFLGLYVTAGFLLTPDKLAALPVHGLVEIGLLIAYGAAAAFGVSAIVLANFAAQGIPQITKGRPQTGPSMQQTVTSRATQALGWLKLAIKLAAFAGILVIGSSAFLLVAGVRAADHAYATVVSPGGAYCGELLNVGGKLSLRLSSGNVVPIAGGSLTQVTSCPP